MRLLHITYDVGFGKMFCGCCGVECFRLFVLLFELFLNGKFELGFHNYKICLFWLTRNPIFTKHVPNMLIVYDTTIKKT